MYNPYNGYPNSYMQNYVPQGQQTSYGQRFQPTAFNDVRFVTEQEANAYIVMANQRVLLIDPQQGKAWIKSADGLGISYVEPYEFSKISEDKKGPEKKPEIDLTAYLKKDELTGMATKDDLKAVTEEVSALKKQIADKSLLVVKPEPKV